MLILGIFLGLFIGNFFVNKACFTPKIYYFTKRNCARFYNSIKNHKNNRKIKR